MTCLGKLIVDGPLKEIVETGSGSFLCCESFLDKKVFLRDRERRTARGVSSVVGTVWGGEEEGYPYPGPGWGRGRGGGYPIIGPDQGTLLLEGIWGQRFESPSLPLRGYLIPEVGVPSYPSLEQTHTCENITSRRSVYTVGKNLNANSF